MNLIKKIFVFFILSCCISNAAPYDPEISSKVDDFLNKKLSPMTGNGGVFFEQGALYSVDPRLIVAISGAESTFGTKWAACAQDGFNAWSWFYKGTCSNSPFSSFTEGIKTVTKFIRKSYINKGYDTIQKIGSKYCVSGCSGWAPNVTNFYTSLNGDVNDLTFSEDPITFEQFSGPSYFSGAQEPLQIGIATISGGQVLSLASNLPADESVVYGTAYFCPGCNQSITIDFSVPIFNFSVFVYNGQTFDVSYTVKDDKGGTTTNTLKANFDYGFGTFYLPSKNISKVVISSSAGNYWDFLIDNIRFSPLGSN